MAEPRKMLDPRKLDTSMLILMMNAEQCAIVLWGEDLNQMPDSKEDAKAEVSRAMAAVAVEIDRRFPIPDEDVGGVLPDESEEETPAQRAADVYPACRRKHTAPPAPAGATCEARIQPYNAKVSEPCGNTGHLVRVGDRNLCTTHAWCRACERPIIEDVGTEAP